MKPLTPNIFNFLLDKIDFLWYTIECKEQMCLLTIKGASMYLAHRSVKGNKYYSIFKSVRINKNKTCQKLVLYLGSINSIFDRFSKGPGERKIQKLFSKQYGALAALLQVAAELELVKTIDKNIPKKNELLTYGQSFLIAVLNRCLEPYSKNLIGDWYEDTFLKNIFHVSPSKLNSRNYWNWMNVFDEPAIDRIQDEVCHVIVKKFGVDLSKIIIDFSNFTTFQIKHKKGQLAQFGKPKDHRYDLRQINYALAVTNEFGIPVRHSTYPGNINDPTYFKAFIKHLISSYCQLLKACEKVIFAHDKGMNSQEGIDLIEKNGYCLVGSLRPSACANLFLVPVAKFKDKYVNKQGKTMIAYRITRELFGCQRTIIITYYEPTFRKNFKTLTQKLSETFFQLNEFAAKINQNKWRTKQAVKKKINTIINKASIKGLIKVKISGRENHLKLSYDIDQKTLQLKIDTMGKSVLFTTDHSLTTEEVIRIYYREKNIIEVSNKLLKDSGFCKISPMWCWTDVQIRAHVFCCVTALLLSTLLQMKLEQKHKIIMSIESIIRALKKIELVTFRLPSLNETFSEVSNLRGVPEKLYNTLNLRSYAKS